VIESNEKVRSNPQCLLTELEDGTGVLLHIETKYYFTLNETGVFLWKQLQRAPHSPRELAEALSTEFEVTVDEALLHVCELLEEMKANRLLQTP
jgi:hypothetical protein